MPAPFAQLLILTPLLAGTPAAPAEPASLAPRFAAVAQTDGAELRPEVEYDSAEEAAGAAKEAMRAGDFERARAILGQVVMLEHFERALAELGDDNPALALTWLDRALEIAPRDLALRTYRAEGLLALAEQSLANGGSGLFVGSAFEDAARAFRALPDSARSGFGAARSLVMLNRPAEALALAERAAAAAPDVAELRFRFGDGIAILAEASYLAFAEQAQAVIDADPESDAQALQAAYARASDHVAEYVAARPEDASAWSTAANLELFQGAASGDAAHTDRALSALREGLGAIPGEPTLLAALVRTANQAGGPARAVSELQQVAQNSGDLPSVAMELGKQRFFSAVASFPQTGDAEPAAYRNTRELFARAQADFAAVRTAEVELGAAAWEAVSQAGEGWAELFAGNYEAAIEQFLATEDVVPGGLRTDFAGNVESGMRGLQTVLARYAAAGASGDGAALQQAAALASKIFELDPEAADAANNAGFFNRDAAVALESAAQAFCRAAAGQADEAQISELRRSAEVAPELYGTEAEKRQFRERANALLERARATMRTSADAYLRAAELAPEDARVQNDTGLVFVHYLHTDLERAEAFLREAVRLGEAQLAETDPEDEDFTALTEAYGDAHENLGVLQLEFSDNPEAARNYFERAVEIGPYERPIVTRYYLPRIDGADELPLARPVTEWGQPCS